VRTQADNGVCAHRYELIEAMDRHGIGTDASIPTHIRNICDRRYVVVCDSEGNPIVEEQHSAGGSRDDFSDPSRGRGRGCGRGGREGNQGRGRGRVRGRGERDSGERTASGGGRHMVPTPLGLALIKGLRRCDASLVEPKLRASMEKQVALIAAGDASKSEVLGTNLAVFSDKYAHFASPAVFEKHVRPLFVDEAAAHAIIASSIAEQQSGRTARTGNAGLLAKAEAKADIASIVTSGMESARRAQQRERSRDALSKSDDERSRLYAAIFG
jgi:hypothetical protein